MAEFPSSRLLKETLYWLFKDRSRSSFQRKIRIPLGSVSNRTVSFRAWYHLTGAMDWIVVPQNSYVEVLTPNVTMSGDRVFGKYYIYADRQWQRDNTKKKRGDYQNW